MNKIFLLIKKFKSSLQSMDRIRKERFYENIANFLNEKTEQDINLCLAATYVICEENDRLSSKELINDVEVNSIIELAREHILGIKLLFRLNDSHMCFTQTKIYFIEDNKPMLTKISEDIHKEQLPDEVREYFLTTGQTDATIKLYP